LDYKKLNDESLIRSIAHAQVDALSELYDRYSRLVFSIAYSSTGNQGSAEEITQDVFTRVWEKAKMYDANLAKVSTWLISITRNRSIDELRRIKVRPDLQSLSWAEIVSDQIPQVNGPEELVEQSIRQHVVRKAVKGLPKDQQTALELAYFKGLTHSEIADLLGEPLGTVKTRIRLAMQKLRQTLEKEI